MAALFASKKAMANVMTTVEPGPKPDYANMSGAQLLAFLGDDGRKWAEAFCSIYNSLPPERREIGVGWMTGWFANAIECACQVRHERGQPTVRPVELPDGCLFWIPK